MARDIKVLQRLLPKPVTVQTLMTMFNYYALVAIYPKERS